MSGVRRVFAGVHGSLGSLQALRFAANEARNRDARLVPVIAWIPPGGDLAERRQPNLQLRKLWRDAAQERLWDAFDRGLGGLPADLSIEALVVRGPACRSWWTAPKTPTTCSSSGRAPGACGGCSAVRPAATASRTPAAR